MGALVEMAKTYIEAGYDSTLLREISTTADFDYALRNAMNKVVLAGYQSVPKEFETICDKRSVKDFRTVYASRVADQANFLQVPEGADYLDSEKTEEEQTYAVKKFGRVFSISWETLVNDDLGSIMRSIRTFGQAAVNTQNALFATRLTNADGTELLSDGCAVVTSSCTINNSNANTIGSSLGTAIAQLAIQTDLQGNPIVCKAATLAVGPLKWSEAWEMTKSVYKIGGTNLEARDQRYTQINPIMVIGLGSSIKSFVFADKNLSGPAMEVAYLQGKEEPEIMEEASNAGKSFDADIIRYRGRLVFNFAWIDRRLVYQMNS